MNAIQTLDLFFGSIIPSKMTTEQERDTETYYQTIRNTFLRRMELRQQCFFDQYISCRYDR